MQYTYKVTITTEDKKDVIEIGRIEEGVDKEERTVITGIKINLDTADDNVSQKSNAVLAKLEIDGFIREQIKTQLVALFDWTCEEDEDKWYRTVEIEIRSSNNKAVRSFRFEKVFVVDYKEEYHQKDDMCTFKLTLTQKENYLDCAKTFAF